MVTNKANWKLPYFLQMTAIKEDHTSPCHEYRLWGDSVLQLVDAAHVVTPWLSVLHHADIMEYLIWEGVPGPSKSAIKKWEYRPTLRN